VWAGTFAVLALAVCAGCPSAVRAPRPFAPLTDGTTHGPVERRYTDGLPAEAGTRAPDGQRTGVWTTWHPNGTLASQGSYFQGKRTGTWSTWYPSGRPQDRGALRDGTPIGLWLYWDDHGSPKREPDRFIEYFDDGRESMRGATRDGESRENLPVCVVGFADPFCQAIVLAEIGVSVPLGISLDAGILINIDRDNGVGVTVGYLAADPDYEAFAAAARYRRWLGSWLALEAGVGVLIAKGDGGSGVTGQAGLEIFDIVSVVAGADRRGDTTVGFVGLRFGVVGLVGAYDILTK